MAEGYPPADGGEGFGAWYGAWFPAPSMGDGGSFSRFCFIWPAGAS